ncbi:MAG: sulfite exporter TauE/SafE family protein [Candidatus Altiarchaeia archaeon]
MTNKKTGVFRIEGMTCSHCEKTVVKAAKSVDGVFSASADSGTGTGRITYDPEKTGPEKVFKRIEEEGYSCRLQGEKKGKNSPVGSFVSVLLVLAGAYLLFGGLFEADMPDIDQNASLFLVFTLGLVTGFHCIAMCGGFVISYSSKHAANGGNGLTSHLIYGASKTLGYTIIGGLFGLLGSFIAFTPMIKGVAAALAGSFLVLYGANMLGLIRFRLKGPSFLDKYSKSNSGNPAVIGLANSLMLACGPLQAMYVIAAATGSPITGALYLFIFGLGTLPVLLGFGVLASVISGRFTQGIMRYAGVIVILLGLVMLNRGLILTGTGYDYKSVFGRSGASLEPGTITTTTQYNTQTTQNATVSSPPTTQTYQVIYMNVTARGWQPDTFTLKKGVPVKWVIDGQQITGCNKAIQVPKLNLQFDIKKGRQTIEFTPTEAGTIPWSCWMGMIDGKFIVVE